MSGAAEPSKRIRRAARRAQAGERPGAPAAPGPSSPVIALAPNGRLHLEPAAAGDEGLPAGALAERVVRAFAHGAGHGLLHLGTREHDELLPAGLAFFRDVAARFVARLCAVPELEQRRGEVALPAPGEELAALAAAAPPFVGAEYLDPTVLAELWDAAGDA